MVMTSPDDLQILEIMRAQIRECYGRVVYTHKTHEKSADICLFRLNLLKLTQIILSAITTGGILMNIFGDGKIYAIMSAISSSILLGINLYTKNYDLGKAAQKHKDAADKLWNIRESYLSLLADIASRSISVNEVRKTRDRLQKSLASIYSLAPRTNSSAYKIAQKSLKINEDMTFSNAEIDAFLPGLLRSTSTN